MTESGKRLVMACRRFLILMFADRVLCVENVLVLSRFAFASGSTPASGC